MTVARGTRPRAASQREIESPRLRALRARIEEGDQQALDDFWGKIAEHGAPLVEATDQPERPLVTFLFRGPLPDAVAAGEPKVQSVRLFGGSDEGGTPEFAQLSGSDVWFTSFHLPNDLRTLYKLQVRRQASRGRSNESVELDSLNPHVFETTFANSPGWSDSALELPGAAEQPWALPREDVPHGEIEELMFHSDISGHDRRVWVYTPPGYAPEHGPYPLLLLTDGQAYVACGSAPATLDNLIAEGRIPPTVAVMVSIPEGDPEARLELYACSDIYNEFLARELIPWVRSHVHVTVDPRWTAIGGSSLGGLAAAYAGLRLYFIFGNVLSQSGSYWWRPEGDHEHEWLARRYVDETPRPVQFFLCVGLLETDTTPGNGPTQVMVNRHMRDVLRARGYSVTYAEYREGHNFLSWRGSLAEGLLALFGQTPEE